MSTCMFCHIGECDLHCDDCGTEVVPDLSSPTPYWPVCCDGCFNRIAEEKLRALESSHD